MKNTTGLLLAAIFILITTACNRKISKSASANEEVLYTGVLVKHGICSQRVIEVTGNKQGLEFLESWTDESTNKTYKNVFAVKNVCDFPADIKEGDTLQFKKGMIIKECAVCMAYTPVPEKHEEILVIQ